MRALLRRPLFWIALVAALAGGAYALVRARGPSVRTTAATLQDIEHHIVASGRVWVPTRIQVSSQVSGLVIAVGAVEGQTVKRGDLLVQIDDAEARAAVAQARAAVEQANARVEQLRRVGAIVASESLRQAQVNLERAEQDLERTRKLAKSGVVTDAALDEAHRALAIARAQKTAAEAQQMSSSPMGADSRLALGALLQAQAQVAGAEARLEQTRIAAVDDGTVLTRSVEPGDVVQPAQTLLVMAVEADAQLVFHPDERNLSFIALGQKAHASAIAYPQQPFEAEVSYVAPSIDPQRGSVEVRLRVFNPPAFLKPDMTVSVDVTVARKEDVVVLPSWVVQDAASPVPWVWLVQDHHIARREVVLGIHGDGAAEITSGLTEGSLVAWPEGQHLRDGQRVRPESG